MGNQEEPPLIPDTVTTTVENHAPSTPLLSSPLDMYSILTQTPILSVQNAIDPDGDTLTYEFEIFPNSDLTPPTLTSINGVSETDTYTSWQCDATLEEDTWYSWRARAFDGIEYSPWMDGARFLVNTENHPPSPPTIISPEDQEEVNILQPELVIGNSTDPDGEIMLSYEFEVYEDANMENLVASEIVSSETIDTTSWIISEVLNENTWYYWQVRATDGVAYSDWAFSSFFISTGDISVEMNLLDGWSMISLPVIPDNASLPSLFPEAVVVYCYEKEAGYSRVTKEDNLDVGRGYWILLDQNQNYTLTGLPIQSYNLQLNEDGWDMIGGCTDPAQVLTDSCSIGVIYSYVQGLGYQRILSGENLIPGKGYWILLNNVMDQAVLTVETTGQ